jgi:hypothetical protein
MQYHDCRESIIWRTQGGGNDSSGLLATNDQLPETDSFATLDRP